MTRVLMFVPHYPHPVTGGLEKQAHELTKALGVQGVTVQALAGKFVVDQPISDLVDGVPVTRIPWSGHKFRRVISAPAALAYQLWRRRGTFDLVHVHQHSWVSIYVIMVAHLLGKATIAKLAGVGEFGLPGIRRSMLGSVKQRILLSTDAVIAMSPQSLAELVDAGFPRERILCTPNGIALNDLQSDRKRTGRICQVVFVGRLSEEKQLNVLLQAWAALGEAEARVAHLHIWGTGPLETILRHRVTQLGIEHRVTLAGHVSNVQSRLAEMDIFVLPSRTEGNSNAILEAMAAGLPVVSTAVGGTPMQVGPEGRRLLCAPGDPVVLREALSELINEPRARYTLGAAMRRRVERHFDIRKVASTYAAAYRKLSVERRGANLSAISSAVVVTGDD